jgi:hypothetical protein
MRTYVLSAMFFIAYSSLVKTGGSITSPFYSQTVNKSEKKNVFDVTVHRLSGDRVVISWHVDEESDQSRFEVMRRQRGGIFTSLASVEAKSRDHNLTDYSFVDINSFADSSFYCVKETSASNVVFFSTTRGIEGIAKDR